MALLITCVEPDSDAIAAVIGHAHISIPNAALLRSSVLRTVAGDVQDGEHVPIPAEETGFQEWLKTVNAVNDVQCQALLSSLGTDAVVQIVQVSPSLIVALQALPPLTERVQRHVGRGRTAVLQRNSIMTSATLGHLTHCFYESCAEAAACVTVRLHLNCCSLYAQDQAPPVSRGASHCV